MMAAPSNTLTLLEQSQLIRQVGGEPDEEYMFKHGLVQETAYDSLLKQDRKRLHQFVAQALERTHPRALDALAPLLAQHWDHAGETARAYEYYVRAGDNAARIYANAEALAAYDRARDLSNDIPLSSEQLQHLYTNRGRVLELRGSYDRALENYQQEETTGQSRSDSSLELDALIHRTTLYVTPNKLFDLTHGLDLANRALTLARASGNRPAEAQVLWNLLLLHHFNGDYEQAIQYGEASLAIAREFNLREQEAYALNDLVRPYSFSGRRAQALAASAQARALWRELGNLPMLTDNLTTAAWQSFFRGEYLDTIQDLEEALRISQDIGNLWGQAFAGETLGMVYFVLGDITRALDLLQDATVNGAQANFLDAVYTGKTYIAFLYGLLGAPQRGIDLIEHLLKQTPYSTGEWLVSPYAVLVILYSDLGNLERAHEAYSRAQSAFEGKPGSPAQTFLGIATAHWQLAQGNPRAAYERIRDQLQYTEARITHPFLGSALRPFQTINLYYQGIALEQLERLAEAEDALTAALQEAEATHSKAFLWNILAARARLAAARGDRSAAAQWNQKARVEIQYLADHAPADLRATFLNRPDVRAITQDEQSSNL